MKKNLEYRDHKSNKFREVTVRGDSHTVRIGHSGAQGEGQRKEFSSTEEALKDAERLAAFKSENGYKEENVVIENQVEPDFSEILSAQNSDQMHQALVRHFSYLAGSPDFAPLLEAIVRSSISVEVEDGNLVLHLELDGDQSIVSHAESEEYMELPVVFQKYNSIH